MRRLPSIAADYYLTFQEEEKKKVTKFHALTLCRRRSGENRKVLVKFVQVSFDMTATTLKVRRFWPVLYMLFL